MNYQFSHTKFCSKSFTILFDMDFAGPFSWAFSKVEDKKSSRTWLCSAPLPLDHHTSLPVFPSSSDFFSENFFPL